MDEEGGVAWEGSLKKKQRKLLSTASPEHFGHEGSPSLPVPAQSPSLRAVPFHGPVPLLPWVPIQKKRDLLGHFSGRRQNSLWHGGCQFLGGNLPGVFWHLVLVLLLVPMPCREALRGCGWDFPSAFTNLQRRW